MAPGGRGRAGKFNKPTRGGGKKFSKDLAPLDAEGNQINMWGQDSRVTKKEEDSSEEESSEEDSDESSEEDETPKEEMTREQRRAAAKAKKQAAIAKKNQKAAEPGDLPPSSSDEDSDDDDMPANPNHSAKSRSQASAAPLDPSAAKATSSKGGDTSQLSRREREAIQAQQARERYLKLHAEGKTDEARADLARLALIKEKRETEAARKKAEKEEKEEAERKRLEEMDDKERKKREAALGSAAGAKKGKKKA